MRKSLFIPISLIGLMLFSSVVSALPPKSQWITPTSGGCPVGSVDYWMIMGDIEYGGGCIAIKDLSELEKSNYVNHLKQWGRQDLLNAYNTFLSQKQPTNLKKTPTISKEKILLQITKRIDAQKTSQKKIQQIKLLITQYTASQKLAQRRGYTEQVRTYQEVIDSLRIRLNTLQVENQTLQGQSKAPQSSSTPVKTTTGVTNKSTQNSTQTDKNSSLSNTCNSNTTNGRLADWCPVVDAKFIYTGPQVITKTGDIKITGKYYKYAQIKITIDDVIQTSFLAWEDGTVDTTVKITNGKTLKIIDKASGNTLATISIKIGDTSSAVSSSQTVLTDWTEAMLYEAISNGAIARDIANGTKHMNPDSLTNEKIVSAINRLRADYGLAPLKYNPLLAKVAKNHSIYMKNNGTSGGHNELSSKSGFTGVSPTDRAISVGYMDRVGENLALIQGDIPYSLMSLLSVPYHRMGFLEDFSEIGFCMDADCYGVFILGGKNTTSLTSLVYPKNGSSVFEYQTDIQENPNPFPGYSANGFVISLWNKAPIDTKSIRLVDMQTNQAVPIKMAVDFNSQCTGSVCMSVTQKGSQGAQFRVEEALHFVNTEKLIEGRTYMVEYQTNTSSESTTNRSYFVAGVGKIASNLPATQSNSKLSTAGTTLANSVILTKENSETRTGYISMTKDPSGQYTFAYVDSDVKRVYNLIFSQQDISWLLRNKQTTPGVTVPNGYEMSIVEDVRFMIANIRKPSNIEGGGEFAMYEADAKIVQ